MGISHWGVFPGVLDRYGWRAVSFDFWSLWSCQVGVGEDT